MIGLLFNEINSIKKDSINELTIKNEDLINNNKKLETIIKENLREIKDLKEQIKLIYENNIVNMENEIKDIKNDLKKNKEHFNYFNRNNHFNEKYQNKENEIKEVNENRANDININNNNNINDKKNENIEINNIKKEVKSIKIENEKNKFNETKQIKEEISEQTQSNLQKQGNYIIAIYEIKKNKLNNKIKILNYSNENKKDIEESCEIYLDDKKINFCFNYCFEKEGKYSIKFIFNKLLKNTNNLFNSCNNIISLDLSNFDTKNVIEMRKMFSDCISLTSLNLLGLNTINVTKMDNMFSNCLSLNELNLSSLQTDNVIDMFSMFFFKIIKYI